VGVFVNETFSGIMGIVDACGLDAVQLHGQEPPDMIYRLRREGLLVVKALFITRAPGLSGVDNYQPSGFLVECGAGKLPGGNAETWDWARARPLADRYPLILAGGLTPENITQAIARGQPDAVDLSSGVEAAPGNKDLVKVAALMAAVRRCRMERRAREIF
jgi:phosphoribosylanthranilate isomerase